MKVLPSVFSYASVLKPFFHVVLILFFALSLFAQDYPNSVGPAPQIDYAISYEPAPFQIGTRAFTQLYNQVTCRFGKLYMEFCSPTNIGVPFSITFPGGLLYKEGVVYTWNQVAPFQVWSIDTVTGIHSQVLTLTGVPHVNLTGMCWDGLNVYGVSTSLAASQIFTINWSTGVCSPIGTPSTACAGAIFLASRINAAAGLFAVDIVLDNLYKFNKTTGVATIVGPLGANANYGQDASFDNNDGKLYWMSYTTAPQLRVIDTATGSPGPIICTYSDQATGIACVPSSGPPPLAYCRNGLNVPIQDFQTARDSVFVDLSGSIILDVNVKIDTVFHSSDSDLRFYLQRGGTPVSVRIINSVGGSGDNFIKTMLDDGATIPIANGTPPFTGTYIPSSPLASFMGPGSSSYWRLLITDTSGGETGFLKAWCLYFLYLAGGVIKTLEIPNYYFLNQNYPNPFNPTTIIKFGIPETENVKLIVYDVLGKEVKTLLDEIKYPGTYVVDFDGTNLSSGIYFYKLETPNFVQVKKMLLVK